MPFVREATEPNWLKWYFDEYPIPQLYHIRLRCASRQGYEKGEAAGVVTSTRGTLFFVGQFFLVLVADILGRCFNLACSFYEPERRAGLGLGVYDHGKRYIARVETQVLGVEIEHAGAFNGKLVVAGQVLRLRGA